MSFERAIEGNDDIVPPGERIKHEGNGLMLKASPRLNIIGERAHTDIIDDLSSSASFNRGSI